MLVVTAARPPLDPPQAELVESVTAQAATVHLRLAPLSEEAVGLIVRATLGSAPEPGFVRACHQATAGNLFLWETLVSALAEEGVRPEAGEAPRAAEFATRAVSTVRVSRRSQPVFT